MTEFLMAMAESSVTPWLILGGAAALVMVRAWHESHEAMMGDLFADGFDD